MPSRQQRRRTKGWRMPANGVSITRPGPWGNPFRVVTGTGRFRIAALKAGFCRTAEEAITKFREYAMERLEREPDWLDPLRGKDLYCFCPLGQPCHGDVLLELLTLKGQS